MQSLAANRRTIRYAAWSAGPIILVAGLMWRLLGGAGLTIAALLALPWLAWRYDNQTGTFFPLAVLLLFVIAVLGLLLFLVVTMLFGAR
jgi:hypothetical protein